MVIWEDESEHINDQEVKVNRDVWVKLNHRLAMLMILAAVTVPCFIGSIGMNLALGASLRNLDQSVDNMIAQSAKVAVKPTVTAKLKVIPEPKVDPDMLDECIFAEKWYHVWLAKTDEDKPGEICDTIKGFKNDVDKFPLEVRLLARKRLGI